MKKIFLILTAFIISGTSVFALDIVYPKTNPAKINAPSTFFIGSINPGEQLTINNISVPVSAIGAFAQVIPLNVGINNFIISSGVDKINFTISRAQPSAAPAQNQTLTEYPFVNFVVIKDSAPLRATPVNAGINRLSHLPTGTNLLINGEKGNFYRVFLNDCLSGWVLKSDVKQSPASTPQAQIKDFKIRDDKDFCFYEVELTSRVPFTVNDESGLKVKLFNLQNTDGAYNLDIPIPKLSGYDYYYQDNKFVLKVHKTLKINKEKPLNDIKITIDAGHGGCELGAIGCMGDKEKDINLAIAKNLEGELKSRGAKVFMTRNDDSQISLNDRVQKAKDTESTILISIHANALPDGGNPIANRGTSVYYYHNQAKPLADAILSTMTTQLGTNNDKVRQGSLALVRPTSSVSVLVEVAYIINPDDSALLINPDFQKNCAKSIADGIEKYLNNEFLSD